MAHLIQLQPNVAQAACFERAAGIARFAWNWALAEWERQYQAGGKPSQGTIRKKFTEVKHTEYPWVSEVPELVTSVAMQNVGKAYPKWFDDRKKNRIKPKPRDKWYKAKIDSELVSFPPGHPRLKKKGRSRKSFCPVAGIAHIKIEGNHIHIPKIGRLRMCEALRFEGEPIRATISERGGKWYVSVSVRIPDWKTPHRESQAVGGLDVGSRKLGVLYDGKETVIYENPHALVRAQKRLRRMQRKAARQEGRNRDTGNPGSEGWSKTQRRIARLHWRISNIRSNAQHQMTTDVIRRCNDLGIENLNVKGMMQGRSAKSLADAGLGELLRQVKYKAELYGTTLVEADRFYPSSKTCSACGHRNADLKSQERWACPQCGIIHDRDENSAINLRTMAVGAISPELTPVERTDKPGNVELPVQPSLFEAGTLEPGATLSGVKG